MSDVPPNVIRRAAGLHENGWTPNFDYKPGDRIKAGRPRFRRSRRVLAGWLERVAGEIQR